MIHGTDRGKLASRHMVTLSDQYIDAAHPKCCRAAAKSRYV